MFWLKTLWRDIKGNAKFAIILALGVVVLDWIRNGPGWQVFGVLSLWIAALFLLLIGAQRTHKWIGWSLIIVGAVISVFSIASHEIKRSKTDRTVESTQANRVIGDDNTIVGNVRMPNNMGSGNTVIGPTDDRGNTFLTNPGAIGYGAKAGPGSIAIGAGAMAGVTVAPVSSIENQRAIALSVPSNGIYESSFLVGVSNPSKTVMFSLRWPACTVSNRMRLATSVGNSVSVGGGQPPRSYPYNEYIVTIFTSCPVAESDFSKFQLRPAPEYKAE